MFSKKEQNGWDNNPVQKKTNVFFVMLFTSILLWGIIVGCASLQVGSRQTTVNPDIDANVPIGYKPSGTPGVMPGTNR